MQAKKLLPATKLNWLKEIGVDTYWLATQVAATTQPSTPPQPIEQPPAPKISDNTANIKASNSLAELYNCFTQEFVALNKHFVFGAGLAQKPKYMLIGEQPGLDDELVGKPFQGDHGTLLQAIFASAKLPDAQSCFMTYLLKYRLSGGHKPNENTIKHALVYLRREIELIQPENIIALGKISAQALLGQETSFTGLRGKSHTYSLDNGQELALWVSHTPAALLVYGSRKEQAWRDFVAISKYNQN